MAGKFFLPVATFLTGVALWVAFLVLLAVRRELFDRSRWLALGVCVFVAGLVAYSGFRCRQVGGPRLGNIVRCGVLVVATAVTFWRAGIAPAAPLALGAFFTGALALTATE